MSLENSNFDECTIKAEDLEIRALFGQFKKVADELIEADFYIVDAEEELWFQEYSMCPEERQRAIQKVVYHFSLDEIEHLLSYVKECICIHDQEIGEFEVLMKSVPIFMVIENVRQIFAETFSLKYTSVLLKEIKERCSNVNYFECLKYLLEDAKFFFLKILIDEENRKKP